MRTPVVDYRDFRFSKLCEKRFSHLKYLGGWIVYFILHFLTEVLIPNDRCFVVKGALDDVIPFCEYFIIPYVGWYLLIVFSLVYFALFNPDNFKSMMKFIIFCQLTAMVIYIIFPNRQDLRPEVFPRDNFCTDIVKLIYSIDTNTNVCPSMHVAFSLGIASAWLKEKGAARFTRALIVLFCAVVCVSVAFVKQHSVVDIYAAAGLGIIAELFAYGSFWKEKFSKRK